MKTWNLAIILSGVLLHIVGCTMVQPIPLAARAGDTIMLPVGSPEGMTASNTTITFVSDSNPGYPIDVTSGIRSIAKTYPDKTSAAWLTGSTSSITTNSAHGPWMTVITLNLPSTLPVGMGKFHLATSASVTYPTYSARADAVAIDFEVLPGTGQPNPFSYKPFGGNSSAVVGNLANLGPLPQLLIKPPLLDSMEAQSYGAIEIKLNAPIRKSTGAVVNTAGLAVVLDEQPQNVTAQVQLSWSRSGDDFTIYIVSPLGTMYYYQARCSIVVKNSNTTGSIAFPIQPTLTSISYFDVNGDPADGPEPELVVQ